MSLHREKFAAAKKLLDKRDYKSARAILEGISHPQAREWEAKINRLDPQPMQATPTKQILGTKTVLAILGGVVLIVVLLVVLQNLRVTPTAEQSVQNTAVVSFDLNAATNYCTATLKDSDTGAYSMKLRLNICIREQKCLADHNNNAAWNNSCNSIAISTLNCEEFNPTATTSEIADCANKEYIKVWCKDSASNKDPMCEELRQKGY